MDIFVLVSKLLGIYLVVSGLFLLFKTKAVPLVLKDFLNHRSVSFLTGVILIFLSSMFIIQHSIWDGGWRMVITIIAWLTLLKGIVYIFFPKSFKWMTTGSEKMFRLWGIISIVFGIYLFFLSDIKVLF